MNSFKRILHPTDFSEPSQAACVQAVDLAKQCGAKLIILHAFADPMTVEAMWAIPDPRPELQEAISQIAHDEAAISVERVLRVGPPAETIVACARNHHCDLIVMGTHGRSGWSHLLLGSIAQQVIRTAPCPVMIVRAGATTESAGVQAKAEMATA